MRRIASAAAAGMVAALVLGACGLTDNTDHKDGKSPSSNPAPAPTSSPTTYKTYQVVPVTTTSDFRVTLGKEENYAAFIVNFARGPLMSPSLKNLSAAAPPQTPGAFSNGSGTVLGSACKLKAGDKAFPFSISVLGASTVSASRANTWLKAFQPFDGTREAALLPDSVQMEFTGSQSRPECRNGAVASIPTSNLLYFAGPRRNFKMTITGWFILRGDALAKGLKLSITANSPYSGYSEDKVTDINGEFAPYKLGTDHGRVVAGGIMPLTK